MAKIPHKKPGDVWVPEATFKVNEVLTDPTTLTVRQQDSAGTETILLNAGDPTVLNAGSNPVAKTATGTFRLNPGIAVTASGYWFVRFVGTGSAAGTQDFQVIVDPSEFTSDAGVGTRALVTLAETKDWLNIVQEDTSEDLDLVRMINDLSQRLMDEADREFKPISTSASARTFIVDTGTVYTRRVLLGDMAAAPTLVEIIDRDAATVLDTPASTSYTLLPTVRQAWQPYRRLEFNPLYVQTLRYGMRVRVTSTWGFPTVPGNIRQAVLDTIAAARDRHVESYSVDLSAPTGNTGTNVILNPRQQQVLALPPRAQAVAQSYRDPIVV